MLVLLVFNVMHHILISCGIIKLFEFELNLNAVALSLRFEVERRLPPFKKKKSFLLQAIDSVIFVGFPPAGSVSSSSTLHIFRQAIIATCDGSLLAVSLSAQSLPLIPAYLGQRIHRGL